MQFKTNRQFLSGAILVFYLLPLLFFASYSIRLMPLFKSWLILCFGLLLIACSSLILILLLFYWEKGLREKAENEQGLRQIQQLDDGQDKENKVTSLDPSLAYDEDQESEITPVKDQTKQLNLLETALKESQDEKIHIYETLQTKEEENRNLKEENEQFRLKVQQSLQDFSDYKVFTEEQLKQKQLQIHSLQQLIEDQRGEMEKRQDQIFQLDTKVHDLSYEIKTLLYLHESEILPQKKNYREKNSGSLGDLPPDISHISASGETMEPVYTESMVRTPVEGNDLLRKCVAMAQKFTGANYYSNEASRYREFSSSNYAIDQRRLYDGLRNEKEGLIIVYSQKDHKLVFTNQQSKTLLGWSPDQFISNFSQIIHEGLSDWRRGLNHLNTALECQIRLLARNKNGQEILLNCHLGYVASGLFRNHVIGVLYPI